MLLDNQPTAFDLRFRFLGFPVRVSPFFWLVMALFGQNEFQRGIEFGLIWVACGFISILVHELGHALAMRRFGSPARIELFAFGGMATASYASPSAYRRLWIAAAGPAAGATLFGIVYGTQELFDWARTNPYTTVIYSALFMMNLYWTIFNLLPIWPFDGGHILREMLVIRNVRQPDFQTQKISFVFALVLGIFGIAMNFGPREMVINLAKSLPMWLLYVIPGPVMSLFLLLIAYQSYEAMKQYRRPHLYNDDEGYPWRGRR